MLEEASACSELRTGGGKSGCTFWGPNVISGASVTDYASYCSLI